MLDLVIIVKRFPNGAYGRTEIPDARRWRTRSVRPNVSIQPYLPSL
jgi:hypothetical protein